MFCGLISTTRFTSRLTRLGNTIDMIEWIYGSEWMIESQKSESRRIEKKGEVWTKFKREFPPVANRLLKYETVVTEISEKHKVPLEMLYHGSQGIASYRIEARIELGANGVVVGGEINQFGDCRPRRGVRQNPATSEETCGRVGLSSQPVTQLPFSPCPFFLVCEYMLDVDLDVAGREILLC